MVKRVKYWKAGVVLSTALAFCVAASLPSSAQTLYQVAQSYISQHGTSGGWVYYQVSPSPAAPAANQGTGTTGTTGSTGTQGTGTTGTTGSTGTQGTGTTGTTGSTGTQGTGTTGTQTSTSLPSLSHIWADYSSSYSLNASEQQLLSLVNQQRVANHEQPYTVNMKLSYLARLRAEDMAKYQNLTHYLPDYGTPPQMEEAAGVYGSPMGAENICEGPSVTVDNAALFGSPPHRANLLDAQETQIGLGVVRSSNGIVWVSELFLGS